MKVCYHSLYYVTLSYDGVFQVHIYEEIPMSMEDILLNVQADFKQYSDFEFCDIIDCKTGEVLATAYNHD